MAAEPTFNELLGDCRYSALHLEMRDGYSRTDPAFIAWQSSHDLDPLPWYGSWLDLLRPVVERGVIVRRARVVSEPISDYVRFEYDITESLNLAAGEDVRWLSRQHASDLALPGNDFWLFDDHTMIINHFSGAGESTNHELCTDAETIKLCASSFAAVWERAVPHHTYHAA